MGSTNKTHLALISQEKVWKDDSGTNGMLDQFVYVEGHVGIGSLLADVLQDVMSAQTSPSFLLF